MILRCAQCGRFLAEVKRFGRGICPKCGSETVYRSRVERKAEPATRLD